MSEQFNDRRVVFADTSAFLAMGFDRDARAHDARRIARRLAVGRWDLVTTYFVLAELHALANACVGPAFAIDLLEKIEDGRTFIVHTRDEDWQSARSIVRRYRDKDFSMTDALSFAVMERQKIALAFTFDHHFAQYGFHVVDEHFT